LNCPRARVRAGTHLPFAWTMAVVFALADVEAVRSRLPRLASGLAAAAAAACLSVLWKVDVRQSGGARLAPHDRQDHAITGRSEIALRA
jgi:hypothetical protein